MDKSSEYVNLQNQLSERDCRISNLEQELSVKKAKTAEMEKSISELTDKSFVIIDLAERLNLLFYGLRENAHTGIGKKFENLLTESSKRIAFNRLKKEVGRMSQVQKRYTFSVSQRLTHC